MSAFFLWDTEPVAKAILEEFQKQGRSIDPKDYELGVDDWGNPVKINMPELVGDEYFTDEWDVNVYEDDGVFSIVAYPVYDGVVECSAWITCKRVQMKKYEICVVSKEYRTVIVQAESPEKAEQKVWDMLGNGVDSLNAESIVLETDLYLEQEYDPNQQADEDQYQEER